MPVKIRLMRIGARKRPFFRVVAVDEQKKRTGAYLELLGTYNPLTEPKEIILKQDRIDEWLKKGAQPSDGFLRITGKAPQRPPRKPKKDKKETADVSLPAGQAGPQTSDKIEKTEAKTEEPTAEEAVPAETPAEPETPKAEDQQVSEPAEAVNPQTSEPEEQAEKAAEDTQAPENRNTDQADTTDNTDTPAPADNPEEEPKA